MFLISTFVLLVGTVYAWFTLGKENEVSFIEFNIGGNVDVETFLYVKKNDGPEVIILSQEDLSNILALGIPSDDYQFRLKLKNNSSNNQTVSIMLLNMTSYNVIEDADIRDVYLLKDSKVKYGSTDITLTPSVGPTTGYLNQPLNQYRLTRYLDASDNMNLISNASLLALETVDVIFNIKFDSGIYCSAYTGYIEIEKLLITIT
jgi:hypothetical protein